MTIQRARGDLLLTTAMAVTASGRAVDYVLGDEAIPPIETLWFFGVGIWGWLFSALAVLLWLAVWREWSTIRRYGVAGQYAFVTSHAFGVAVYLAFTIALFGAYDPAREVINARSLAVPVAGFLIHAVRWNTARSILDVRKRSGLDDLVQPRDGLGDLVGIAEQIFARRNRRLGRNSPQD